MSADDLVRCADCAAYIHNPRAWSGIGRCQADAPASRVPGSLWPGSEIRCSAFAQATHQGADAPTPIQPSTPAPAAPERPS
jgi:hypothetical protein